MSELRETPMRPVNVALICRCGGEMEFTEVALMSMPPQFPHRCWRCGATETREKAYPCIEYRETQWRE